MNQEKIQKIEELMKALPQGCLVYKNIRGKKQPYLQWTENGKTKSKYIKAAERELVLKQLDLKKELQQELKRLRQEEFHSIGRIAENADSLYFRMHVIYGEELERMLLSVEKFQKRDCFGTLQKYIRGNYEGRVCLLYGLRRTGKTTLLLQTIADLGEEERRQAVYIKARTNNTMSDLSSDLKQLSDAGYRYIFLDEVTLMEDFIDSAAVLSDIYAMMSMKIVLSGTDSLGFWFTLKQELYDRAFTIHTTFIPFHEYSRLLGISDIDEYIRYGGTLRMGEADFEDEDLLQENACFRDDESTRRYIDSAICRNIQHSLICCQDGNYLRHLSELYEEDELTGAINRIIESMNHQFLLRTLTRPFKSHDLGSAAEMLRKQADPEKRSDVLDHIDRESVTVRLMEILEIRNREDQKVGIRKEHIAEIKEYLKALDLICDCPSENAIAGSAPSEYVLFTQPGMRYSQAQALVYALLKDPVFAACGEQEKSLVCGKILEDVRGRMMEDMILLETARSLTKQKRAFKLTLSRSEFDMLIYDTESCTCEAYEIKHSAKITEHQYHVLEDSEACEQAEKIYGTIRKKCVIYRGENRILENGIIYRNAEEYLESIGS